MRRYFLWAALTCLCGAWDCGSADPGPAQPLHVANDEGEGGGGGGSAGGGKVVASDPAVIQQGPVSGGATEEGAPVRGDPVDESPPVEETTTTCPADRCSGYSGLVTYTLTKNKCVATTITCDCGCCLPTNECNDCSSS